MTIDCLRRQHGSREAGKKNQQAAVTAKVASRASRHPRSHRSIATPTMSALPNMDQIGLAV
jgi:hypothetical protein